MKENKVTKFVKKHKGLIGTAVTTIIVGGCCYAIGRAGGFKEVLKFINKDDINTVTMPGFVIEGGLTIADIGKLGDEFIKHDPVLTKDTVILEVGNFMFE